MTPNDLEMLQMNARMAAHEVALGNIVRSLSRESAMRDSLRRCIAEIGVAGTESPIPGSSPEYSMLLAGETKEAFDALAKYLMKRTEA